MTRKRTAIAVLFVVASVALLWYWTVEPELVGNVTLVAALLVALMLLGRLMPASITGLPFVGLDRNVLDHSRTRVIQESRALEPRGPERKTER